MRRCECECLSRLLLPLAPQYHQHSEDVALGTAECSHEKGKQREQPMAPMQNSTPDDPSSAAELDSRENRALWKSIFRARKKGGKEAPAEVLAWDPSPPVVEVYARRVPQVSFGSSRSRLCSVLTIYGWIRGMPYSRQNRRKSLRLA